MATNPRTDIPTPDSLEAEYPDKPEGPISAAIIAGGIGALALGIFTTLAEISEPFKNFLNFYKPVGPLAGKTTYAVVIWLVSWVVLHFMYKDRAMESRKALTVALILVALGRPGHLPDLLPGVCPGVGRKDPAEAPFRMSGASDAYRRSFTERC